MLSAEKAILDQPECATHEPGSPAPSDPSLSPPPPGHPAASPALTCPGRWAAEFQRTYLASLRQYQHFYDDFSEYGHAGSARHAFYFIPGINGTPGQIRFAFPSLIKRFGRDLYIRGCFLPEFSALRPMWEKYTIANVLKKRAQISRDLEEMLGRFSRVNVLVSSNGLYDFVAIWNCLPAGAARRLRLLWVACAPDQFGSSFWVDVFYRLNGFTLDGCRWAAVPNSNWLRWLNPETNTHLNWSHGFQRRVFFKEDIESRFHLGGLCWDYVSPECFSRGLELVTRAHREPLDVEAYVLAGTRDGYWYGTPPGSMKATLDRYLARQTVVMRPASHLWVVTPDHLTEFFNQVPAD
jgi:hypothetical protein